MSNLGPTWPQLDANLGASFNGLTPTFIDEVSIMNSSISGSAAKEKMTLHPDL